MTIYPGQYWCKQGSGNVAQVQGMDDNYVVMEWANGRVTEVKRPNLRSKFHWYPVKP